MSKQIETELVYRGLALTAEDIADALWLASYLIVETTPAVELPDAGDTVEDGGDLEVETPQDDAFTADQEDGRGAPVIEPSGEPSDTQAYAELYRAPEQTRRKRLPGEGLPFYAPAGDALPDKLTISRALRSLLRRVPSRHRVVLDEEATAEQIADGNDLALVLRPQNDRWLDLVLVIDESPSMVIWHRAIQELHTLLLQLGAFRAIESWGIGYESDAQTQAYRSIYLHVTSGGGRVYGRRGHKRELITATQNRLILVVTDTSSAAWQENTIGEWLSLWGEHNMVAIWHMLPNPYWQGTGLRKAVEVKVRSSEAGTRNSRLALDEIAWYWTKDEAPQAPPVPVTTLEPHLLGAWAKMLSGREQKRVFGYCFEPPEDKKPPRRRERQTPLSPVGEERLLMYQNRLSPLARTLAGYLAAVPLSLPIMRLVQRVLLPDTTQINLAEVFHSGILLRSSERYESTLDPDTLQYDFLDDDLRRLFLTSIGDETRRYVLEKVSTYVDSHSRLPYSFRALLFDPTFSGRVELDAKGQPFARVAAQVLRTLGGVYAELAEKLEQGVKDGFIVVDAGPAAPIDESPAWEALQRGVAGVFEALTDLQVIRTQAAREQEPPVIVAETKIDVDGDVETLTPTQEEAKGVDQTWAAVHQASIAAFTELRTQLLAALQTLAPQPTKHPGKQITLPHIVQGGTALEMEWCWVPGGPFTMGSDEYDNEKPLHEVKVDDFWLARTPVTNAQYRLFIEAGGYQERRWWSDAGWQWRENRSITQPQYWENSKWNSAAQPVVGVSWYEAEAFCRWAVETTGEPLRLPTEAEWEKAARGTDQRKYPWGNNEPTDKLCNFDSNIGQTTPVGQYSPDGDSPYGCTDMAGNVYDWTASWYQAYIGNQKPDEDYGEKYRVVRGGSWNDDAIDMRTSNRLRNPPEDRDVNVGFRCASTPF